MLICPECHKESIVLTTRCWNCGRPFTIEDSLHELRFDGSASSGDRHPSGGGSDTYWIL